jgi:hypothetical protein
LFNSVEKIVYVDPAVEKFATILHKKNILKVENSDHSSLFANNFVSGKFFENIQIRLKSCIF